MSYLSKSFTLYMIIPEMLMMMKVGSEKITKAINPPIQEYVAYIDKAITNCVEVGPGNDWQRVNS